MERTKSKGTGGTGSIGLVGGRGYCKSRLSPESPP